MNPVHALAGTLQAVLLLMAAQAAAPAREATRPNVLLVMSDDQGYGDAGYCGNEVLRTPNLDAMASAGLRFDRF